MDVVQAADLRQYRLQLMRVDLCRTLLPTRLPPLLGGILQGRQLSELSTVPGAGEDDAQVLIFTAIKGTQT